MSVAEAEQIILPASLEFVEAMELKDNLSERLGLPLTLNASEVSYLGTHCLQILLSAAKHWREHGLPFNIINPSKEFSTGVTRMGISPSDFTSDSDVK